ncbi:branched-chain amino acid transport system ATP-binding protein [Paucibacter oligotrophus]|uniref:Branched-chain amino acid transport system ATP-binding protein n=1 Tax=Roseateles oligotrophus TaxID=1769250 RepID=A0A840LJ48_9BURK|nr:ABC transporter ATP-binding protein [Roseateles oligotrophus]MBB4846238.1 branched-chain amino acid transport system ATP-binding protein [Roseateles oligotrophus]
MSTQTGKSCLQIREVRMSFGALHAVDGVSLDLGLGERHALLGTNGAGKTTLFNLITGDLLPTSGQIHLYGHDITALPAHRRCALGIGRTYQIPLLFGGLSVLENLVIAARGPRLGGFSLRPIREDADSHLLARELCARVGLGSFAQASVSLLSHGQKKQLELGMALATQPSVLLLDEPAAGLSPNDRKTLTGLILDLPRELSILFVEHDMEVAMMLADRVTVMKDGRIFASGFPDDVRKDEQVLRLYMGEPLELFA